jgi:ABC-type antimicrobial peptide transport system permease subunit
LSGVGGLLGLLFAWLGIALIGDVELAMELSWEISPSPHFLPETDFDRTRMLVAPIQMPLLTSALAWILAILTAVSSAVLAGFKMVRPHPWRWLAED